MPNTPASILCVDDETNVLSALKRELRRTRHQVHTCASGEEALEHLGTNRVDVVIADLRMPGMDGVELLAAVARDHPGTLRILLSGQADFGASVRAINEGRVFAFVEKPWDREELFQLIEAGLSVRQSEQIEAPLASQLNAPAEQASLDALHAITPLFERLTTLTDGHKPGHGGRVAEIVRDFCRHLGLRPRSVQDIYVAGLMHDIGEIELPENVRNAPNTRLQGADLAAFRQHPARGAELLGGVPELAGAASLIRLHHERHDGKGFPDGLCADQIPVPARVLSVADAFDEAMHGYVYPRRLSEPEVWDYLSSERGIRFDPRVVTAFLRWRRHLQSTDGSEEFGLPLRELKPGMKLTRDLKTADGILLVPSGHRLTSGLIQRILSLAAGGPEDIRAHVSSAEGNS